MIYLCWILTTVTSIHQLNEKKRKREFGQEEKTMKRIRCCVIGVFGSPWMHSCEAWKTGECMDRKGGDGGRVEGKEKRVEEEEVEKKGKGKKWFWEKPFLFFFSQPNFVGICQSPNWQRAIHTVSRERGWVLSRDGLMPGRVEWGLKESERGWVWLMDGVEVSVMGWSSTLVNVSPCTRPSCLRNSLVCIDANVFLPAQPISWCWCVLPGVDTVQGVQKVEWLWGWCRCRAAIPPMPGHTQHCVPCHTMRLSSEPWLSVPSWNARCVCGTNEFTESPFACTKNAHSGFTNLHSKCTWSTVILPPHLHLSVCGKVLFVFVWLCVCLFPFFPCTHHATTPQHTHTHTQYTT